MAAVHAITVDAADARAREAVDAAIADVQRIEAKYSRYRDDSLLSRINRAAGVHSVEIDDETRALLDYADRCHALSQGRFDVTSGVYRRAWDFRRDPPRIPVPEQIEALRDLVGWHYVERKGRSVYLRKRGMQLDFGGIGKEYAADRAATILQQHGIVHALVNLGGDVRAVGAQASGSPWHIGIRHPRDPEPAVIASVDVAEGAIATSGDYERFFEIDGRRYCHIIDALTGMPVSAWQSISVAAPLAIVAGSCSTIAMLMGDEAAAFLRDQRVAWIGIDASGRRVGSLGQ